MMMPASGQHMMMPQQGMMPPQGMMMPSQGMMMMPQQSDAQCDTPSRSSRGSARAGSRPAAAGTRKLGRQASAGSGGRSPSGRLRSPRGMPRFKDDHHGVSSSFKSLGLEHVHGKKRVMPKSFRASMIVCCDPVLFPMYRLAALGSQDTYFSILLSLDAALQRDQLTFKLKPSARCGRQPATLMSFLRRLRRVLIKGVVKLKYLGGFVFKVFLW